MRRASSVDDYIDNAEHWQAELLRLREILKSTRLEETVKWGGPCYTWKGKNLDAGQEIKADRNRTLALPMITAGIGLNDKYR